MLNAPLLAPGQLISASIRLDRMLGRGGMGSVWVAEHLRLKTKVVVKFVAAEFVDNADVLARFEREAAAAAAAKSPHVVQIHDYGTTEHGIPFIAMEFLEGEDLGKRLERGGPVPAPEFAEWLTQACKGLSRAHAQGIVHRDIKPENIFLCNMDGEVFVKLLDFGIAKAQAAAGSFASTRTGAFLGTAYYMSPEQTMGAKNVDHRSDLWSLGVVAYEALTGVRPFEAEAIGALVAAITALPIPAPSNHRPELGAAIDTWMERALARDPAQRFSTAREMAEAFAAAARQIVPGVVPAGRPAVISEVPTPAAPAVWSGSSPSDPTGLQTRPSVAPHAIVHDTVPAQAAGISSNRDRSSSAGLAPATSAGLSRSSPEPLGSNTGSTRPSSAGKPASLLRWGALVASALVVTAVVTVRSYSRNVGAPTEPAPRPGPSLEVTHPFDRASGTAPARSAADPKDTEFNGATTRPAASSEPPNAGTAPNAPSSVAPTPSSTASSSVAPLPPSTWTARTSVPSHGPLRLPVAPPPGRQVRSPAVSASTSSAPPRPSAPPVQPAPLDDDDMR